MRNSGAEKRERDRYEKDFSVKMIPFSLDDYEYTQKSRKAKGVDVSEKGVGIVDSIHTKLEKNKPLEMEIRFKDSTQSFNALGFVKWKKKRGKKMHVGIEFYAMYDWEKYKNGVTEKKGHEV